MFDNQPAFKYLIPRDHPLPSFDLSFLCHDNRFCTGVKLRPASSAEHLENLKGGEIFRACFRPLLCSFDDDQMAW